MVQVWWNFAYKEMRDRKAGSMLHLTSYTICHSRQVSRVPRIRTHNNQMKMMAGFSSKGDHLHRSGAWIIERCEREQGGRSGMYACQPNPLARHCWAEAGSWWEVSVIGHERTQGLAIPTPALAILCRRERESERDRRWGEGQRQNDRNKKKNWRRDLRGSTTQRPRCCAHTAL